MVEFSYYIYDFLISFYNNCLRNFSYFALFTRRSAFSVTFGVAVAYWEWVQRLQQECLFPLMIASCDKLRFSDQEPDIAT